MVETNEVRILVNRIGASDCRLYAIFLGDRLRSHGFMLRDSRLSCDVVLITTSQDSRQLAAEVTPVVHLIRSATAF